MLYNNIDETKLLKLKKKITELEMENLRKEKSDSKQKMVDKIMKEIEREIEKCY